MVCHPFTHEILERRYSYLPHHINKFDNGQTRLKYQSRSNFYKSTQICRREKELRVHGDLCVAFGTYKFKKKI